MSKNIFLMKTRFTVLPPFYFKIKLAVVGRVFKIDLHTHFLKFNFISFNSKLLFFNEINLKVKKPNKQCLIIEYFNLLKQLKSANLVRLLKLVKYVNIFTGRGLNTNKLIFFKKSGKVSSYNLC